jgi:hypothetical protein
MSKTVGAVLAVVAVIAGLAIGAVPAQSQGNRTTIEALDLDRDDRGFETDVNRQGFSKGDSFGFTSPLLDPESRDRIGGLTAICTSVTVTRKSQKSVQLCHGTATFAAGQLAVTGRFKFAPETESAIFVVTGGTEDYEGAAGFMRLEFQEEGTRLTFDFSTN